jgi:hypothetical protein
VLISGAIAEYFSLEGDTINLAGPVIAAHFDVVALLLRSRPMGSGVGEQPPIEQGRVWPRPDGFIPDCFGGHSIPRRDNRRVLAKPESVMNSVGAIVAQLALSRINFVSAVLGPGAGPEGVHDSRHY